MSHYAHLFQVVLISIILHRVGLEIRRWFKTTQLRGPSSESIAFGIVKRVAGASDAGAVYEAWADTYGQVYQVPGPFGTKRIVLCDSKAATHVCMLDSWNYTHSPIARRQLSSLTGPNGLLSTLGEAHKRQRRVLNPLFAQTAINSYTPIFFDIGYRVKAAWDIIMQSGTSDEVIINISDWMDHVSLDTIGLACFSHDFGSLLGYTSPVAESLAALGNFKPSRVTIMIMLLAQAFPSLLKFTPQRNALVARLSDSMTAITASLLQKARTEGNRDKSALGVLLTAENTQLSEAEVRMKSLLLAGNETTSVMLKWALLDLSMNPDKQDKLRAELLPFTAADPTYHDLANGLPYLDAVVREVVRLHPSLGETTRVALEDDVIPLARPVKTKSGTTVDRLLVAKGTTVTIPIHCLNRASSIWGDDSKRFVPERWLMKDALPQRAREFPGYHHTLTFMEGPRTCLGKGFALMEIKAVLSVLIRNYVFSPCNGPGTKYETARRIVPHPKVAGEEGNRLPMRVRRVE